MNISKPDGDSAVLFLLKQICCASFTGCVSEMATIPLDTAKVRL